MVLVNGIVLIVGGGGSSEVVNTLEEIPLISVNRDYGYPTNVYHKCAVVDECIWEYTNIRFRYRDYISCIYVKFAQGNSQSSSADVPSTIGGIVMPSVEMSSGNLKLTPSGEIYALGRHESGTFYGGWLMWSWSEQVRI